MAHALDDAAVDPLVLDEEQVGAIAALLRADEHRELCHPIVADSPDISRLFCASRDTTFQRRLI